MSDFFSGGSGGSSGGLTGGMSNAAKLAAGALLIHQLMKYAQNQAPQSQATQSQAGTAGMAPETGGLGGMLGGLLGGGAATAGAGGLGGLLGGLLGGRGLPMGTGAGSGGLGGLGSLVAGGGLGGLLGGLGGLLGNLRSQGLGQQVDSWVSPGPNQQVSPQDLERGFDPGELDEAARHAGTDRDTLLREMSGLLPQLVDRATPQGSMPQRDEDVGQGGFGGLLGNLFGGDQPAAGPGVTRRG